MENQKSALFNQLFTTKVTRFKNNKNGMGVSTGIECNNPVLKAHMTKLFNKYKSNIGNRNDFDSEYLYWAWRSINRFEIRDTSEGTWEDLLENNCPALLGKIIKNIKTTTDNEIYRYSNPNAKFTRGTVEGKKGQHVTLKIQIDSLDSVLFTEDATTMEDFITEEDSIFGNNITHEYYITYFHNWFNEYKDKILTKSQLKLLEDLNKCKKVEGYTVNDIEAYTGVPSNKINARLNRIQNRITRAWEKAKPIPKNRLELERDNQMELLSEYIAIANDDANLDTQNLRLTNWLKREFNVTLIMDMLDEVMVGEEVKNTNRVLQGKEGQIPSTVLYKFLTRAEKRLEQLMKMDCATKKVTKQINKQNQEYKNRLKAWSTPVTYVLDSEGEFKRLEVSEQKPRKMNIIYVLPNGIQVPTDGQFFQ